MQDIKAPAAPEILPPALKTQWQKTWLKEYEQAQADSPGDEAAQLATASRIANRILNPDKPTSYEEAMELPEWQCVHRGEKNGKLWVVLINSKKFSFRYTGRQWKWTGSQCHDEERTDRPCRNPWH